MTSYCIIMIDNVYAKLFCRFMESKLNTWTEYFQKNAHIQASFGTTYNTIDHILTLCVLWKKFKVNKIALFVTSLISKKLLTVYLVNSCEKICNSLEYHQISQQPLPRYNILNQQFTNSRDLEYHQNHSFSYSIWSFHR